MHSDDAWGAVAELAASRHGVISRTQAADHGISAKRISTLLRSGVLDEPVPRVLRFRGSPTTWHQRLTIATLAHGGAAASHRSAARLHRLDGFDRAPVEVISPIGHLVRMPGVVPHRWTGLSDDDCCVVDGIRSTNVAVTLCQLGAVVGDNQLDAAFQSALRSGASETWIIETLERLRRPGPSGTKNLRRVLGRRGAEGRTESELERRLLRVVERSRLPPPVLQHEVVTDLGRRARIDLAWPAVRLGLEAHSRRYHFGTQREAADHARHLDLAAAGWDIQYVTWHQLQEPETLVRRLEAIHDQRHRSTRR